MTMDRPGNLRATLTAALATAAFMLFGSAAASAQTRGPQALPPAAPQAQAEPDASVPSPDIIYDEATQFNRTERWLIPSYFQKLRDKQRRAARSKVYQRILPAGLENPPVAGDVLSASVLANLHRLPGPLVRDLPARRPDTQRYVAGKDILLVQPSTGKVLDVIAGVIH